MEEPWFYLFDGQHQYELSEMSGGERAIFPMIFDFAYWNICNSVVLIDELELHLHPPLQQGLLKALRKLGKNNQFIITTHSEAVTSIVSEESIRRL
jgi:predicted ATP-binding protein involved in virulence